MNDIYFTFKSLLIYFFDSDQNASDIDILHILKFIQKNFLKMRDVQKNILAKFFKGPVLNLIL